LWADNSPQGSLCINVILGGFSLALCRQVAAFAPNRVDRAIMGYAMQDAARHVSYGTGALRFHLQHQPELRLGLNAFLDSAEHVLIALLGSPELLEPLIIICGGGVERQQIKSACAAAAKLAR